VKAILKTRVSGMDFFTAGLGARPLPARFHCEEEGLAGAACRRSTPEPGARGSGLRNKAHELYPSTPRAVHLFQARRQTAPMHAWRRRAACARRLPVHPVSRVLCGACWYYAPGVMLEINESNP